MFSFFGNRNVAANQQSQESISSSLLDNASSSQCTNKDDSKEENDIENCPNPNTSPTLLRILPPRSIGTTTTPVNNRQTMADMFDDMLTNTDGASQFIAQQEADNALLDHDGCPVTDVNSQSIADFKPMNSQKEKIVFHDDLSKQEIQKSMLVEYSMITESAKTTLGVSDINRVTHETLFSYYFGNESKFVIIFMKYVNVDYEYFLKFVSTTLLLQAYCLSITMLHDDSSSIDKKVISEECLTYDEYVNTWNVLSIDKRDPDGSDSIWKKLEICFNEMTKELLLSTNKNDLDGNLRLVLDDDKLHCDGLKPGTWDTIKRVKHVVCNRWGANVHTLAGSVSGIIYSICIETKEDSTIDCLKHCLEVCFRMGNSRHPNLKNVILGVDRGYGGKGLVSYITQHFGNIFGTVKRSLFNPFTYDQKSRGSWDQRSFKSKEGFTVVERLIAPMKDDNGKKVSDLVSIFYRNGFGGATLLHSTLPCHQHDEWDRVPNSKKEVDREKGYTFFKPHPFFASSSHLSSFQKQLLNSVNNKFQIITEDQNVWEWFCARRFSQTASAAMKYINLGFKDECFREKDTWKQISKYHQKGQAADQNLDIEEIIPEFHENDFVLGENESVSIETFQDSDCIAWMTTLDNLIILSENREKKKLWRALQNAFKLASGVSDTSIDPKKIHDWLISSSEAKALYGLDTVPKMKAALRKRMPKGHSRYNFIRTMDGKYSDHYSFSMTKVKFSLLTKKYRIQFFIVQSMN